ncbi:MAG: IS630 family transposase [Nitrospira sp.]|nr:IS630 family transposase [Nitrospira sp.]
MPSWPRKSDVEKTVQRWRKRWHEQGSIHNASRPGVPRQFSAVVRAQIIGLACSHPADHGKVYKKWSGEKLAQVAIEKGMVTSISASTVRRWLREDKMKPWQHHSWQKSSDPQFVEKATPVLELYEKAQQLGQQGEVVGCVDEKTSIQARKRMTDTEPAIPDHPVQVSDRYERKGSLNLFCFLMVATGIPFARGYARKRFSEFKEFLQELFTHLCDKGVKLLDLILDNGPTHAPKRLGKWIATLSLSFQVRIFWLPKHASWLDQVEIIFSKVQRQVLTPNDFPSTEALHKDLLAYFDELNKHPKPIQWTYTKEKLIAKFGSSPPI